MTTSKRGGSFWVVTWEGTDESIVKGSKGHVAAILSARKSEKYVAQFTEELYALSLDLEDQIEKSRYLNPRIAYPTKIEGRRIHCGHNPHLSARRVKNMAVEVDENDIEVAKWDAA